MASPKQPGIAVDAGGGAVIDPTQNVLDLVEAERRRQDDLREAERRYFDAENKHVKEMVKLQAVHNQQIRTLESDRLDKIRTVDVQNAAASAAQLLSAVTTLATTQQATAETLRNQVAATASAVASQTERVINPIIERLSLLERATASTSGKGEGVNLAWVVLLGVVSLFGGLLGIAGVLYAVLKQ